MKSKKKSGTIEVPAVQIRQGRGDGRTLYSFAVNAKTVWSFATVSRIKRDEKAQLDGYQRPKVIAHIQEIKDYIESDSPILPNAVVIAFMCPLDFKPLKRVVGTGEGTLGILSIPVDEPDVPQEKRPGFIVDGQQRLAAIGEASVETFPVFVSAFVVDDEREQTEQFILVNATKPLPKALIHELLPSTDAKLPVLLERRRPAARRLARLNHDETSPLREMIRTVTNPRGKIKDNSVLKMLEHSLSDGLLRSLHDRADGNPDPEVAFHVVCEFWRAVKNVFPDAWGKPPKSSRLMHGAGIVSLGLVMDEIAHHHRTKNLTADLFAGELKKLKAFCAWTEGEWEFEDGARAWNGVQNTPKDVELLANHLANKYKAVVGRRGEQGRAKRTGNAARAKAGSHSKTPRSTVSRRR